MAAKKEFDYSFNLVLIGDSGVGKSSVLLRFAEDSFRQDFSATIGVDYRVRTTVINNKTVKLQIWDTAGQEQFRTITAAYYRKADGIITVFDVTNSESFDDVESWLTEANMHIVPNTYIAKLLVGNKADLADKRQVSTQTAQQFADKLKIQYLETSAKTATNIEAAFMTIAKELVEHRVPDKPDSDRVDPNKPQPGPSTTCC